ncbi:putative RNA-directed DNA polymerase [Tanacetum coccineum]
MMEPQPKAPRLPAITPPQPPPSAISAPPRPSPEVVDIVKCNHNKKREESHRVLLHSQMSWSQKGGGEVKAEARVTELKKENRKKNYNNQKNKHKKDDDGDENTEVNTTTDEFLVCYDYDMVNLANDDLSWILESGATCHVATRKYYYSSYTPGDFGVVRMGNTGLSRIAGIGDICLKFDTGMELVLHNVKHVPDMRLKIISTGLLDEDGYHNSSGNGLWKVTLGSLIVARVKRESKLYMTHPKISKSIVNAVDNDDMTELWNKRLGHMIEKGMSILSKKNMLSSVHDINLKNCYHCLAGKQTRLAFKSRSPFRIENILDLVHSDVKRSRNLKQIRNRNFTEVYFLTVP